MVYLTLLLSCITNIKPTEAGEGSTRAGVVDPEGSGGFECGQARLWFLGHTG